jgi:predicted DNA-binding protein
MYASMRAPYHYDRENAMKTEGKLYASVTISMDVEIWHRIDDLAKKLGITRHAMARIVIEKGVEAYENRARGEKQILEHS